jgi:5-methylcytosine-specific restriction endonuclease McrA
MKESLIIYSNNNYLRHINTEQYEYNGWIITISDSEECDKYSGIAVPLKYSHILSINTPVGIEDEILQENGVDLNEEDWDCIRLELFDEKEYHRWRINSESPQSVLQYFINHIITIDDIEKPDIVVLKQIYKKTIIPKSSKSKRGFMHTAWSSLVKYRDKKCKKCGSEYNLHAHHIKKFSLYDELKYDVNNGITLCYSCHRKHHKKTTND